MIENVRNRKYTIIFTIVFIIIIFLLLVIMFLIFEYKMYKYNSLNNGTTSINYYYKYFKENEKKFNNLANYMIENKITAINKNEEYLMCSDQTLKNVKDISFCSDDEIDIIDDSITSFLSDGIIEKIYITGDNNYYVFIIYSSGTKGITYKYCIEDCHNEDQIKTEKKAEMLRYMIDIKIDDHWSFAYHESL